MIIETIFQSFALAAAVVATLRAGSRAFYFISHEQEVGILDGPLILSPFDVKGLKEAVIDTTSGAIISSAVEDLDIQVSPLWELTHSFSEAVRLLHNVHKDCNSDCSNYFHGDFTLKRSSWSEESQTGYSMSSPHKVTINLPLEEENFDDHQILASKSSDNSDQSLILVSSLDETQLTSSDHHPTIKQKILQSFRRSISTMISIGARTSKLLNQLLSPTPFLFRRQDDYIDIPEFSHNLEDTDETTSDCDTIYSTGLRIPEVKDNYLNEKIDNNPDDSPKIARIRAFAPQTFERLRLLFGVKEEDFLKSILHSGPYVSFQSNSKGAARVGKSNFS